MQNNSRVQVRANLNPCMKWHCGMVGGTLIWRGS